MHPGALALKVTRFRDIDVCQLTVAGYAHKMGPEHTSEHILLSNRVEHDRGHGQHSHSP